MFLLLAVAPVPTVLQLADSARVNVQRYHHWLVSLGPRRCRTVMDPDDSYAAHIADTL